MSRELVKADIDTLLGTETPGAGYGDQVARAAAQALSVDVSSHSTTLTAAESAYGAIVFTGALSAATTFQLASGSGVQVISNNTTGSYDLGVKRGASGVVLVIPQNETVEVR